MGLQKERFQHLVEPNEIPSTATSISTLKQFLNWKQSWSEEQVSLSTAISMPTNDSGQVSRHLHIHLSLKKFDSMDACCLFVPNATGNCRISQSQGICELLKDVYGMSHSPSDYKLGPPPKKVSLSPSLSGHSAQATRTGREGRLSHVPFFLFHPLIWLVLGWETIYP